VTSPFPTVEVICVPYDSGFREHRMGRGPSVIASELVPQLSALGFTTIVHEIVVERSFTAEIATAFELQRSLAAEVRRCRVNGVFPIVLAGNCHTAVGTIAGLRQRASARIGVCWFDAHGDFNTPETTVSGFFDGMALAMVAGRCWRASCRTVLDYRPIAEELVLLCGARDLDPDEAQVLAASRIRRFGSDDATAFQAAVASLGAATDVVYLHLDLDALDSSEGLANPFSCSGGFQSAQLDRWFETIQRSCNVGALAITAYDPGGDVDQRIPTIAWSIAQHVVQRRARRLTPFV
jgi:arginase